MLPPPERHRLLVEWNATAREYPRTSGVHEVFEGQARRAPDAVAVVHGAERVSYGELDARAERLCAVLLEVGVEAGDRVAVDAGALGGAPGGSAGGAQGGGRRTCLWRGGASWLRSGVDACRLRGQDAGDMRSRRRSRPR